MAGSGVEVATPSVRALAKKLGPRKHRAQKKYKLSSLAVTETHMVDDREMKLDDSYVLIYSGRRDGRQSEGVGIALSPQTRAALRYYLSDSPRLLVAEFITQMGPLLVLVGYAYTEQSSDENKDELYSLLDGVMVRAHGLTMVMGDFNATLSKTVSGAIEKHGLAWKTSDNGERLISFACTHGLCVTNTMFLHKQILQAT